MNILGSIVLPAWAKLAAMGAVAGMLFGAGVCAGLRWDAGKVARLEAAQAKAEAAAARAARALTRAQDFVTHVQETAALKTQQQIRTVTRTVVKKVPIYVTPKTDAAFPLPNGFVRLHDAAALGVDPASLSGPAAGADAAASAVTASHAAAVIAENYGICRQAIDEVSRWQAWARAQEEAVNNLGGR